MKFYGSVIQNRKGCSLKHYIVLKCHEVVLKWAQPISAWLFCQKLACFVGSNVGLCVYMTLVFLRATPMVYGSSRLGVD